MGGQIAVIKKHNGKLTGTYGWTNSFSRVTESVDFFTDPDNETLKKYMVVGDQFEDRIVADSYGIVLIDYDIKSFYTINGYSAYLNVLTSGIFMDEQDGNPSPFREFFDKSLLCVRSRSFEKDKKVSDIYTNLDDMKENFESLDDVVKWMDGDRYSNSIIGRLRNGKGNSFIKLPDDVTIHNELYIDFKKLGWESYNFSEDIYGYLELYDQLVKDGHKFSDGELKQLSDYVHNEDLDEDDEDFGKSFYEIVKYKIREQVFTDLEI